jgi:hypothetical protein
MQSHGNNDGVKAAEESLSVQPYARVLREGNAKVLHARDLAVENAFWQPIVRDAGAKVSTGLRLVVKNLYLVAVQCQGIGRRDARGT